MGILERTNVLGAWRRLFMSKSSSAVLGKCPWPGEDRGLCVLASLVSPSTLCSRGSRLL